MSQLRFLSTSLAIAALCGTSVVNAQQGTLGQPVIQNQPIQGQPIQGQQTLPAAGQSGDYQARRVSNDGQQQGPTIKEAITQKLIKANEAEIELAKMAQEKSDNSEVKQLAQMMVKDHQALTEELKSMSSKNGSSGASATVPKELCDIADQACENALKMTKDMLSKYEGQDFNMAFLGQQAVAHTMMLAELKAIQSTGPQELQSVAQTAITKVEKHLKETKDLAKKLEDDSKKG